MRVAETIHLLLHHENWTLKQGWAPGVFCGGELKQWLIKARNEVLRYLNMLHTNAVKLQISIRESFRSIFAFLIQRLQTLFAQEVATVTKQVDVSGFNALIDLRGNISDCKEAAKKRSYRLVGGGLSPIGTNTAVPKAGGTSTAGKVGPSIESTVVYSCCSKKVFYSRRFKF